MKLRAQPHHVSGGKSGRGLPQSKTLRDTRGPLGTPPGLGLRQSSGALIVGLKRGDGRNFVLSLTTCLEGKAVGDYRTPRRSATPGAAGNSARSWTAPVLWRFESGREMGDGRNFVLSLTTCLEGKAVGDYRSPRRSATKQGKTPYGSTAKLVPRPGKSRSAALQGIVLQAFPMRGRGAQFYEGAGWYFGHVDGRAFLGKMLGHAPRFTDEQRPIGKCSG